MVFFGDVFIYQPYQPILNTLELKNINGSLDVAEEKLSNNFTKAKENFCLSLHYSRDNSYLFVGGKEIYKIKANNGNVNFPTQFYLENIFSGFVAVESREVSLKGNVCYFSVDYNAIDKSDI